MALPIMKKITLVHNPSAGFEPVSSVEIIQQLERHGFEVTYISVKDDELYQKLSSIQTDLMLVSGGDGTVHKVAHFVKGRKLPLAIIPSGTANNIASSLGNTCIDLNDKSWFRQLISLTDLGVLHLKGQRINFMESIGIGLLAEMMNQYKVIKKINPPDFENKQHKFSYLYQLLEKQLSVLKPFHCEIWIDNVMYEGKFLWVEVINTPLTGPSLRLAPDAAMDDGLLDVLLIKEDERYKLQHFLKELQQARTETETFDVVKGKMISVQTQVRNLHLDDELLPIDDTHGREISFRAEVEESALHLMYKPLKLS
ncbi:MAG: diacylglycerol/lipid kinase family protein [Cyclobacteriaceae bacterium]